MSAWMVFLRQLPKDIYFPKYLEITFIAALGVSLLILIIVKYSSDRSHRTH